MKRTNQEQHQWEKTKQKNRFAKNLERKDKKYGGIGKVHNNKVFGYEIIEAPARITVYAVEKGANVLVERSLGFFDLLRNQLKSSRVLLDFRNTIRIDAAALLVMYAIVDESLKKSSTKVRYSLPLEGKYVRRQLRNSFFIKLLERSDTTVNFDTLSTLPVISGTLNEKIDELIDYLLQKILKEDATPDQEYIYGDAIQETVHNVGLHAYPARDKTERKWWLLCNVIDDQLFLAIYDLGVGIPQTVVEQQYFLGRLKDVYPNVFRNLLKILPSLGVSKLVLDNLEDKILLSGLLSDEQAIYLSLKPDYSGTRKDKHGQGSKSIRKLVDETENGKLWVFSNRGLYLKKPDEEPTMMSIPGHIGGTLVQWNIKVR